MNWTDFLNEKLEGISKPKLPDDIQLPMLPNVISDFSRESNDPNVSAKKLARIIEVDSGLTCELLKHVNSSAMGMRKKAVAPQQAISMLGIRQSKLFLLTSGLRASLRALDGGCKLIDFKLFWSTNLERALFAREVAKVIHADQEVAFAAAMLGDMMLPVLMKHDESTYEKFTSSQDQPAQALVDFEQETFEFDHAVAAAFVMKDWSFPDDLISCTLCHHQGLNPLENDGLKKTAVAAVAVASLLPDQLQQVPDGTSELIGLEGKLSGFHLDRIATAVDEQFEETASSMENRIPLADRCRECASAAT